MSRQPTGSTSTTAGAAASSRSPMTPISITLGLLRPRSWCHDRPIAATARHAPRHARGPVTARHLSGAGTAAGGLERHGQHAVRPLVDCGQPRAESTSASAITRCSGPNGAAPSCSPGAVICRAHALLKRVAAVAGQTVCERDREVSIDGRTIARTLPVDGRGHRLAALSGCGRLLDGEILVLTPSVPTAIDGRHFEPRPIRAVNGHGTPLWLPEERTR